MIYKQGIQEGERARDFQHHRVIWSRVCLIHFTYNKIALKKTHNEYYLYVDIRRRIKFEAGNI